MISFSCSACGRKFSVPDTFAGRTAQCGCKKMMIVPAHSDPVVPPPMVSSSTAPTGLRQRRLLADEREMAAAFSASPIVRILSAHGTPPERYELEFNVDSLVSGNAKTTTPGHTHRAEIVLTNDYPRVGPKCRMLTPIFHPNIDETSICIGDHWTAGEKLSDLVLRIAEMLAFQAYNIRSPLNAVAAMWADLNGEKLPTDKRDLRAGTG
jgi:ubiquitin-protein ligase